MPGAVKPVYDPVHTHHVRIGRGQAVPPIVWDEQYGVGHPILDAQHRHIIDLINALHNAAAGEGLATVDAVLPHFVRFLENHFETEEVILRQVAYPSVEEHAAAHRTLVHQLTRAAEAAAQDGHTANSMRFAATIWSWLHEHTVSMDQEFAPMLRSLSRINVSGPVE